MGDDANWQDNPLYEAPEWQENPLYDAPAGKIDHVDPEALEQFNQALGARPKEVAANPDNPMEDPDIMKMYVAESLAARRNWDPDNPDANLAALTGAAGDAVATANPGTNARYVTGELDAGTAGATDPETGVVTVRREEFEVQTLDAETVNTMYHESTHVEQLSVANEAAGGDIAALFSEPDGIAQKTERAAALQYEMIDNLGDLNDPQPGTTGWVESQGTYEEYRGLRIEQEAHAAGDAAGRMYQRVGDVHDELEARMATTRAQLDAEAQARSDALDNAAAFAELPNDA